MRRIEPLSVRLRRIADRHPDDAELDHAVFEVEMQEHERERIEHAFVAELEWSHIRYIGLGILVVAAFDALISFAH